MTAMPSVQTLAAALACAASAASASADLLWTGADQHRSASVNFRMFEGDLEVTLTNTSTADALVPIDVLTGVFFTFVGEGTVSLTPVSGVLGPGSTVLFGTPDPGGVVGGEWAWKPDPMLGFTVGLSSSGFGIFGPADRFPGSNLQGPESPNGLQYGLTSATDDPNTGNAPMTGDHALIKNSVTLRLGNLPAGFNLNIIDEVWFQYGTDLCDPHFWGEVPAPGTAVMLAMYGVVCTRRRR
jgi:hypothetical protein